MRVSKPVGAMMASGLFYQVAGQAAYGAPDGNDNVSSAGQVTSPNVQTLTVLGTPGGLDNGKTCVVQPTKTVFVTVSPSSGPSGDESPSGEATPHHATKTIEVSPFGTSLQPVSIFTTLTLDNWTEGSVDTETSGASSGSDVSPAHTTATVSANTNGGSPPSYGTNDGNSEPSWMDESHPGQITLSNAPDHSSHVTATGENPGSATNPAQQTVVTETAIEWKTDENGSSQITVLSEHTITVQGGLETPNVQPQVTQWKITGPDGKATVIQSSVGNTEQSDGLPTSETVIPSQTGTGSQVPQAVTTIVIGQQTPVTTVASLGSAAAVPGSAPTSCTTFTVIGSNGLPTVVHSALVGPTSTPAVTNGDFNPTITFSPESTIQAIPGGQDVTSCTTFTIIGSDGKPTVIESTLIIPASLASATTFPQYIPNPTVSGFATPLSASQVNGAGSAFQPDAVTTCTAFTFLGQDGLLTVVDSTYVVTTPVATSAPDAVTGIPPQTLAPASPSPIPAAQSSTTCITYTAIGANGQPTVVETTLIVPASNALPTGSTGMELPSFVPQGQNNGLPQGTVQAAGLPQGASTTCITIDVLGNDGHATPVVQTIVMTPGASVVQTVATPTIAGLPSFVPQALSSPPQGISIASVLSPITTVVIMTVLGPDGNGTPIVQTIVSTPTAAGPVATSAVNSQIQPSLSAYGSDGISLASVLVPSAVIPGWGGLPSGVSVSALLPSFTIVTGPGGIPALSIVTAGVPSSYAANSDVQGIPTGPVAQGTQGGYGWLPNNAATANKPAPYGGNSLLVAPEQASSTAMVSSTWVNVIAQPTTTYTMKFPFTTLATVVVPVATPKSVFRRQQSDVAPPMSWANSSASVTTLFDSTTVQSLPVATPTPSSSVAPAPASAALCPAGGLVGNTTINFDSITPGPLFNPASDLWFSEGFVVPPHSGQSSQGYTPSSGSQLVEFVPPAMVPVAIGSQSGDTAEVGMGPNSAHPCFRFDLHSASLGCAASRPEEWCEFEVSAYAYNPASASEMDIAWSEVKRVSSCPSFPNAPCSLTPVTFDGYHNMTSVLIRLRVGNELRAWWMDDFKFGWSDSSCEAATCRSSAVAIPKVKRDVVESALSKGVWQWARDGLERLDNSYILNSAK